MIIICLTDIQLLIASSYYYLMIREETGTSSNPTYIVATDLPNFIK